MISDWSGTAYEFALVTERPCVLVDTPPKINNPDYDKITVAPLEFTLRDQVGIRIRPEELSGLAEKISVLAADESFAGRIRQIRETYIANFGRSGEVGGQYLIDLIRKKAAERRGA